MAKDTPVNKKTLPVRDSLGEVKDLNELSYDPEKKSYEYDVPATEKTYDHPVNYETVSTGAVNDDSTYDEANPYVGDEYAQIKDATDDALHEMSMRVEEEDHLKTSVEDQILARTDEDMRDDLDEEGYPKNDDPLRIY